MIYIVLPIHNRVAVTEKFAHALARQTVHDFRLLLIDDGSTDGSAKAVCAILPDFVTVLQGDGSWWWGGSLHQGWLWLGKQNLHEDDIVLMCNDDVDLPADFLARGAELLAQSDNALVVAKAREQDGIAIAETCFAVDYRQCRVTIAVPGEPVACAPTRGMFVRWDTMRKIGGFHPRLLPHYLSDLEWSLRATHRGIMIRRDDRLWLVPNRDTSGIDSLRELPFWRRLQRMFSMKYTMNPLHWTTFILLGFPARYWLPALARVVRWSAGTILGR